MIPPLVCSGGKKIGARIVRFVMGWRAFGLVPTPQVCKGGKIAPSALNRSEVSVSVRRQL